MRYPLPHCVVLLALLTSYCPIDLVTQGAQASTLHPSGLKKYQATITRKDKHNNTKTFTDYCDAKSLSEARNIFEGRYTDGQVSNVREVN